MVFLAAVRLMGEATGALSDPLAGIFAALEDRPVSSLGLSWLTTYLLTNGSVVAALGVTLSSVGPPDPDITVALVSGSRLGGAAFVIMVGVVDHLRRRGSLRSRVELGLLAFVVSHALYIPATLATWAVLPSLGPPLARVTSRIGPDFLRPGVVDAATTALVELVGPVVVAILSIVALFAGVVLFDRALRGFDMDSLRARVPTDRRWLAFSAGLVATGLTSSVAFSIGVLVPLFNRGGVTRKEITPYVLGANVTTLIDTFVVSLVLEAWEAGAAVLTLMLISLALSIAYMTVHSGFFQLVGRVLDGITGTRTVFVLFLISLVAAPLILVLVGSGL